MSMSTPSLARFGSALAILTATALWSLTPAVSAGEVAQSLARPMDLAARSDLFQSLHLGAKVSTWNASSTVYGPAFGDGASALDAAERFRIETLPLMGVDPQDLRLGADFLPEGQTTVPLMYDRATGTYKFTAVIYTQQRGGVPVYNTRLITLVRNEPGFPLVMAESNLRDLGTFRPQPQAAAQPNIGAAQREATQRMNAPAEFVGGQVVIWAGVEEMVVVPKTAYTFQAMSVNPVTGMPDHRVFVADAATGAILYEGSAIHDVDITGNVSGMSTEPPAADICSPEILMPLPYAKVSDGVTTVYTDINGNFTLPSGETDVTVTSTITGLYFDMFNMNGTLTDGPPTAIMQLVTPPGPVDFVHNSANTAEFNRAEVNSYIQANVVRDYLLTYHPTFPTIANETGFDNRVNRGTTCNAFYSSTNQSINFYIAGGSCSNTANATVAHHEYGHRINNAAGAQSPQGAYGEGFSDCMSLLIADHPCLGKGFSSSSSTPPCSTTVADCNGCLRTADNISQYTTSGCSSCGTGHACGMLISGCVWSTRNALLATNPGTYRDIISDLTINSVILHGNSSTITPAITVHFLTLDDNDANIGNGTPHYNEIATGFGAHNMPAPPLQLIAFDFPEGQPNYVNPDGSTTIRVDVTANAGTPLAGTGLLFADTGSGYQQYPMQELAANQYLATIPAANCGVVVKYYFRASADGGQTQFSPPTAPGAFYSATSAFDAVLAINDNFQTDLGWTATFVLVSGTPTGHWVRAVPFTPSNTNTPSVDADGSGMCYVTGNSSLNDVDNGTATLTSPLLNASQTNMVLSYYRWYDTSSTTSDTFLVEFSLDDGGSWTNLETVAPITVGSWILRTYNLDTVPGFTPTSQFRLRFIAQDLGTAQTIEAAVDGVKIEKLICTELCIADVTGNGQVNIDDMLAVINAWGPCPGCPADVDNNGVVNIDDLLAVINGWGACP